MGLPLISIGRRSRCVVTPGGWSAKRAESFRGLSEAGVIYNVDMAPGIPAEIRGQRYISLTTFRKNGAGVRTPVWFAEEKGKLYVMTSSKLGKYKRIRNNPAVKIAPCTMRGKVTGPEFTATARIMKPEEFAGARREINAKYWLARVPLLWRNTDAYLEITPAD
jgi:PPOX class probable F420-dependent enzyme